MKQTRQPFEICLLPPCHWKHWRILTWLFIILKTLFSAFQLHILQNTYMKERRHPELICRHINKLAVTQYMCIADASLYSILLMHSDKRSYWIIYNFDSPEEEWREFREVFNYHNYCHLCTSIRFKTLYKGGSVQGWWFYHYIQFGENI